MSFVSSLFLFRLTSRTLTATGLGVVVLSLFAPIPASAADLSIKSPDGKIVVTISPGDQLKYSVNWNGKPIVANASLGISVNGNNLGQKTRPAGLPQIQPINETYATRGIHDTALNQCFAAIIPLQGGNPAVKWNLEVRAFNDGVAYRYVVPGDGSRRVDGESSEWSLPQDSVLWYLGAKNSSYEDRFHSAKINELEPNSELMAMTTAVLPDSAGYAMITEANIVNYSDMTLTAAGGNVLKATFRNDPHGWVQDKGPIVSPWRVTLLSANLNGLVNTDVIHNLCPPAPFALAGASWIRPGRSSWQWLTAGSPKLEEQHTWVDDTKRMGFEYYLVDDGWKKWDGGGERAWRALEGVVKYAKSQGVSVWAWVNANEVFKPGERDTYFKKARRIGLVGLKVDFPEPASSKWVNWYDDVLHDAAKAELMIDFHGAMKPSGRERTWPNEVSREAIAGREQGRNPSSHDTTLPFVRYVQGHADYTPVLFDPKKLFQSSFAHELAMAVVFTSPFFCYGDNPKNYVSSPAVEILKNLPPVWNQTVVLPFSQIGQVAGFARREKNQWFIGVINGNEPRNEKVPLDFLGEGKFKLIEFADSPTEKNTFVRTERSVTKADALTLPMRGDGGYVAWLAPEK